MGARSGGGLAQPRGRGDGGSRLRSLPLIQPRSPVWTLPSAGQALQMGGHPAWWVQSLFPGLGAGKRGISRIRSFAAGLFRREGLSPATPTDGGCCMHLEGNLRGTFQSKLISSKPIVEISLAVQWLRLHLPGQGMQVQSLVRKLRSHDFWLKNHNIETGAVL